MFERIARNSRESCFDFHSRMSVVRVAVSVNNLVGVKYTRHTAAGCL